jgi:hypothetical protein
MIPRIAGGLVGLLGVPGALLLGFGALFAIGVVLG